MHFRLVRARAPCLDLAERQNAFWQVRHRRGSEGPSALRTSVKDGNVGSDLAGSTKSFSVTVEKRKYRLRPQSPLEHAPRNRGGAPRPTAVPGLTRRSTSSPPSIAEGCR